MNLQKLEKKIGVKFPSKWWKIYQTGAMKWLELSKKIFSSEKNNCIYNPNSFMILNCDCELILFDEIPKQIQKLKEQLNIKSKEQFGNFSFEELNISSNLSFAFTLKLSVLSASLIIFACNNSFSLSPSSICNLL